MIPILVVFVVKMRHHLFMQLQSSGEKTTLWQAKKREKRLCKLYELNSFLTAISHRGLRNDFFFFRQFTFSNFYMDFSIPFLIGHFYPFSFWTFFSLLFPFSFWTLLFFSFLDFYFVLGPLFPLSIWTSISF